MCICIYISFEETNRRSCIVFKVIKKSVYNVNAIYNTYRVLDEKEKIKEVKGREGCNTRADQVKYII